MSPATFEHVTFVVRHCGERTTDACVDLLARTAPGQPIHRVSARPFHEVLRRSLTIGLEQGRPWLLCIDADVLVLPELPGLLAALDGLAPETFEVQGLVLDKLIPSRRAAGNHLYRTALIPKALPLIPERDSLRPESDMIIAMAREGHPSRQTSHVIGVHDYEQDHRDVYMKALLHARKHDFLMPLVRPVWQALARGDADFRVALAAAADTAACDAIRDISRDYPRERIDSVLDGLNLAAKPPLGRTTPEDVAALPTADAVLATDMRPALAAIQARIDAALFPPGPPAPPSLAGALRRLLRR